MAISISPVNAQKVVVYAFNSDGTLSPATIGGGGGTGTVTSLTATSPVVATPTTITTTGAFSCPTCTTNAAALTANALIIGAGGQAESALASLGTTTTVLHGNAAGAPTFGAVNLAADVSGQLPISAVGSGGLSGSSPITISAAGAIACATCNTSAAAITSNVLPKGSGGAQGLANSLATDDGTTFTYTGTGGVSAPKLVSTVATGTAPLAVTSTTNVANLNASSLNGATFASPGSLGSSTPNSVNSTTILNQAHMLFNGAAPTIATGAGATIATNNGSGAFTINVGTGGLTSIVIALSATSVLNGWICSANNRTSMSTTVFITKQTNSVLSTTQVTIGNFTTAGVSAAWNNNDLISLQCTAD